MLACWPGPRAAFLPPGRLCWAGVEGGGVVVGRCGLKTDPCSLRIVITVSAEAERWVHLKFHPELCSVT